MLPVHESTMQLFLHVIAATVWVGAQIALADVLPVLRNTGRTDATRAAARR